MTTNPEIIELGKRLKTEGFMYFHTAMRKAVDDDGSGEVWQLLNKMSGDSIASVNEFVVACLFGYNSEEYKQIMKAE